MAELQKVGLVLPWRDYRSLDKVVQRKFGESISQIAEYNPLGAFDALSFGMTAVYARNGRKLIHRRVDSSGAPTDTGVVDRELDGEQAYSGAMSHTMNGVVSKLVERYLDGAEDFAIQVNRSPGRIRRLLGRHPVQETVAIIPRQIEP